MKHMRNAIIAAVAATSAGALAQTAPVRPDQQGFRSVYRELVESNTTLSSGSCTQAAQLMQARLKAAGIADEQLTLFATDDHPRDGGLVAVLPGRDTKAKAILLLAHLDVVEAKREDWTRDPFTLVEENGYFYARGALDDKAQAAIWVDTLARMAREHYRPRRTIKLALTCGEETTGAFNGVKWLLENRRQLIDAEFALNEGGGGRTDGKPISAGGKLVSLSLQAGEKTFQSFRVTATNPGGHSSMPVRDNAIYELADALLRLRGHEFALEMNDVTRAYFAKAGAARGDDLGKAMIALAANPQDAAAEGAVNQDRALHTMLRTTCVATMLDGGHAQNALPQRASALVNCRMFPGRSAQETHAELVRVIADPKMTVEPVPPVSPSTPVPMLDPKVTGPIERLAAKHYPGVPVIPTLFTAATDGRYLAREGIPSYGVPGLWTDPDGNGTHGLNERLEVRALYQGRDYLYDLVKALAN